MNRFHRHAEVLDLAAALVNGTITPEQHDRLQTLLSDDAEARRAYFDYLDLHLGLRQAHLGKESAQPLFELKRDLDRITPGPRRHRRLLPALVGLAAALVIAVLAFVYRGGRHGSNDPEAVLVQTAGARFYGAAAGLRAGDPIVIGREHALKEGRIEVRFRPGAVAILEGPSVFTALAEDRLRVSFGRCSVHVHEGAEGFALLTPLTRIVDLGTRFSVNVDDTGETDVQVIDGETEIHTPDTPDKTVHLREGDARRYDVGGNEIIPFDRNRAPLEMPDRVVRYTATRRPKTGGAEDLTTVTVHRGGRDIVYPVASLIGIRVIHFKGVGPKDNYVSTVTGGADPAPARHALLDGDTNLNTGLINFGGSPTPLTTDPVMNDPEDPKHPNTPGMAVRFLSPVINGPGPDVVMFEFQPVIQPEHGDPFHVGPLKYGPGLHAHTVLRWDFGTFSPEALTIAGFRLNRFDGRTDTLSALERVPIRGGVDYTVTSKALAVGIDLSDLGYPAGAAVEGLFFQDILDEGNRVDPVFLAGLPPTEDK